jgi:metal-sulfur cluster biosynthetic enzyme
VLRAEATRKILELPDIVAADVELVWEPPWDLSRMSEAARLQLGMW